MDGSNRFVVGQYGKTMDQGPFAAGPTDYSTFDVQYDFIQTYPVGRHELECTAVAYSQAAAPALDFEPSPISTIVVLAPYTGMSYCNLQTQHTLQGRPDTRCVWAMLRC